VRRLEGRVAIVTGASPNIGGALARGLADEGARVVCTDLSAEAAEAAAASITARGGDAMPAVGDVTDPEHAADVIRRAEDRWERIDVLVNNAVWFNQKGLLTMPVDEYRRQLDIILVGALLFTRAVADHLIRRKAPGSVINVLSTAAWQGQPGNIGYTTGKSGLVNFTRSAAMELAHHGIRVNGLTPTATQPDDPETARRMTSVSATSSEWRMDFAGQLPMRRLPTPTDYVPAAVFLASDDSTMITGSNITVDGGATAKYWPWTPHVS
jgi:NAD(P)-dependent dehydrogenase (short-subunit alcohol dehydrogenase family)